jgi:guanylate kinase
MELELGNAFDHKVINDQLRRAIDEVHTIVEHHLHQH